MLKVTVITAHPLAPKTAEAFRTAVKKKHGSDARCEFRVDPSVIGGVKTIIGSKAVDRTVAGQLAAVKKQVLAKVL